MLSRVGHEAEQAEVLPNASVETSRSESRVSSHFRVAPRWLWPGSFERSEDQQEAGDGMGLEGAACCLGGP